MIINTNMASLNTIRQLGINEKNTQSALAKLSSGLRINSAADDAAGLAISEKMRGQISGLNQASSNAQNGISMVSTAEGALNETTSILQRMRELAVQASNDTNTSDDRTAMQTEMNQLTSEINRIGNTTEFNTQKLLKGTNQAAVTTAAGNTVNVAGQTGVAVGSTSALATLANSIAGVNSSASVQASTSAATGTVSTTTQTLPSTAGVAAAVTLTNGVTFRGVDKINGSTLNGTTINIAQGATAGAATTLAYNTTTNTYTFTIGQTAGGASLATDRGSLYNELNNAIQNSAYSGKISIDTMSNTSEVVNDVTASGTLTGGVNEVDGSYNFSLTKAFKEAGDSVTIGGQTFTAVLSGADATKGQFNVGPAQAILTGGSGATSSLGLGGGGGLAGTETLSINVGGTNYTLTNATLKAYATGQADANLQTLIQGAADASGNALSTVANVNIDANTHKISIQSKNADSSPITWNYNGTVSAADQTLLNNVFGIVNTASITGANVTDNTKNLGTYIWDTGALTAATSTAGGAGSISFNGVTVNIATSSAAGAGSIGAANYTTKTIALTIAGADTSATAQAADIANALLAYQSGNSSNDLSNFTISTNTGGTGILIKDTVADFATNSAQTVTLTAGSLTAFAETNATAANQQNSALGGGNTAIAADTNVTVNVNGTDFSISNTALRTTFAGGSPSLTDMKNLIANAVDTSGHKLSSVAAVTDDGANHLVITSLNGNGSNVKYTVNGTDVARVQTALGITSLASSTAATSQSISTTDQAASLAKAIQANSVLGGRFFSPKVTYGSSQLVLTEVPGQATGTALGNAVVAGAGTNDKLLITNTGGQNLSTVTILQGITNAGAQAKTGTVDTSFQVQAQNTGTELNGVKVAFSGLTSAATTNLTSSWDASSRTLTVTGTLDSTLASAVNIGTAIGGAIKNGLANAGFGSAGTIIVSNGASANTAAALTAFNNNSITFGSGTGSVAGATTVVNDTLTVDQNKGNLTIYLANTNPYKNTAANIQAAVNALGSSGATGGIDFSKYQFAAQGSWDTSTIGNNIVQGTSTLVGGTVAVKGSYSFDISKAFSAGDVVDIHGQNFTAVASGAVASKGEFNVSGGDLVAQAAGLSDAISMNNVLKANYTAAASGSTVTINEIAASGTDLKTTDLSVTATGVQGQYTVAANQLLTDGASFNIDGQNIAVSSKTSNVGYANGTAIQQAADLTTQSNELAKAINTNSTLNQKYTASVDSNGNLLMTQKVGNSNAPSVQMTTSTKGDFVAKLQIGANSGQTMTVNVEDMRSVALGISGDGSVSTVAAKNGSVASYTATATVSNGTDNTNIEYALDLTTSDKATAAVSVIDDAINTVSAERSNLGAFQNRLEHTINNLGTASQNITSAEANIRDVDMAAEMTEFQKNNILQQAAQAMLAQANQQPQGVLQLLR